MVDLRLPLKNAHDRGLLPDLAPIREDMKDAALNLLGEFFVDNPRLSLPHTHADFTEAQRALAGVGKIVEDVAPWEWLSLLLYDGASLPWVLWASREVGIGKTGEYIEHLVRIGGGDPDGMVAGYRAEPSPHLPEAFEGNRKEKPRWVRWLPGGNRLPWDKQRGESIDWWRSEEGRADFDARVFAFALKKLPELVALDEK
jgi:hypothetical protein